MFSVGENGLHLSQNGIGNGSNVRVLQRLRGGAGSYLDIPGLWECKVCHVTRVGLPGSDATGVMLQVIQFPTTPPLHGSVGETASSVA